MSEEGRTEPVCRRVKAGQQGPAARGCDWCDCGQQGLYRAPRSRLNLQDYWWFCLEHVRQYNATWNYYIGMSEAEVEADIRRDTVWQRPTWPLGPGSAGYNHRFRWQDDGSGEPPEQPQTPPPRAASPLARALITLELEPPVTVATVKARYKLLVKRYHPDANGGDKASEERFKTISEAYRMVMTSLSP